MTDYFQGSRAMKLPAAAYSAEAATLRLRRPEATWYLAKFSDPSAGAFGRRAEATTPLRQGYGGFSSPSSL